MTGKWLLTMWITAVLMTQAGALICLRQAAGETLPADNPVPSRVEGVKAAPFSGTVLYVSPTGDDRADGTVSRPFRTLSRALRDAVPGTLILLRGGIYDIDVGLNVSGQEDLPIIIQSFPGELAIFDGSKYDPSQSVKFRVTGSWLVIRNIEVRNGPSDGVLLTEGAGHNLLENLTVHDNYFAGIELENGAHHNIIRNCDSFRNFDYGQSLGEHADGFGAKFSVGPGNLFTGCRAWTNSDDGFDLWEAGNPVTIEGCWAWKNGFDIWGAGAEFAGDGNGFKLGPGAHVIHHCMAWNNARRGFDFNDSQGPITVLNNTSFNHPLHGFKFSWGSHVLKNNLSFKDRANYIGDSVLQQNNSWNLSPDIVIRPEDFKSLNDSTASGPRRPGGLLPETDFLAPSAGSCLVDTGAETSLFWYGNGPDIGAVESSYRRLNTD